MMLLKLLIKPQAKTAVDVRAEGSMRLPEETPPFFVVAQMTIPRPAAGMITDLTENKWLILDVWMNKKGMVKQKARKKPIILPVLALCSEVGDP